MPLANVSPSGAPNNACGGSRVPTPPMRGRRNAEQAPPRPSNGAIPPEPGNKRTRKGLHTTFSPFLYIKIRCHQMIWIGHSSHWSLVLKIQDSPRQCKKAGRDHVCTPVPRHQSSPATPLCAFAGNGPKARGHAPDGSFLAALPSAVGHRHGRGQRLVPLRPTVPDPAEPDVRCS